MNINKEVFIREYIESLVNHIHLKRSMRLFELGRGECMIIIYLSEHEENCTPGDLSKVLSVGSGRIGNALKGLERKQFIIRTVDENDKRKAIVRLTEKGKQFSEERKQEMIQRIGNIYEILGVDDSMELIRIIQKINKELE